MSRHERASDMTSGREVTAPADHPDAQPGARLVCGIGASAGGLRPIEAFFDAVGPTPGLAFVVIQHLSPDHESMMAELLAQHTSMVVAEAHDGQLLEANQVYLIPPGTSLVTENRHLRVRPRIDEAGHPHRPVDRFFASLAEDYAENAIAIVLSGTGTDGTEGMRTVALAGGLTLVQDATAAFDGMPDSARRSGLAGDALPPDELAGAVRDHAHSTHTGVGTDSDDELQVLDVLARTSGVNFRDYKPATMRRRIANRRAVSDLSAAGYAELVEADPKEHDALMADLLIGVTEFYRDESAWALIEDLIEVLIADAIDRDEDVRMWVPGCATGEEAYSYAMAAAATMDRRSAGNEPNVQIFATDLHAPALSTASAGWYDDTTVTHVPVDYRERYMTTEGNGWRVNQRIRSMVSFAEHDLLQDPPFAQMDLVSCRNVLIYFNGTAQERALSALAYAVKKDRWLVLGSSESLGAEAVRFDTVHPEWRIFNKIDAGLLEPRRNPSGSHPRPAPIARVPPPSSEQRLLRAYDAVLDAHFVGGLLVNERRELIHTIGAASDWLRQPKGRPTFDALSLIADPELRLALAAGLRALESAEQPPPRSVVVPMSDGEPALATLHGSAIRNGTDEFYLFHMAPQQSATSAEAPIALAAAPEGATVETLAYAEQLEGELGYLRQSLQTAIDEQETSNEELRATNEELTAANEELQSTNEELSSVNEELRTLNEEHRQRLEQVLELSADLEQLMSSIEIGVIFLAEDQTVRRFNDPAREYFRVRETDIGRPFADLRSALLLPELAQALEDVFEGREGVTIRCTMTNDPTRHLIVRLDRYELARSRSGVFIAVVDVTDLFLVDQEKALSRFAQAAPLNISIWDSEHRWVFCDPPIESELSASQLIGRSPTDVFPSEIAARVIAENDRILESTDGQGELQVSTVGPDATQDGSYVTSKFRFEVDGVAHIGGLAIAASQLSDLIDLQEDRRFLRAVTQSVLTAAVTLDADGAVRDFAGELGPDDSAWPQDAPLGVDERLSIISAIGKANRESNEQRRILPTNGPDGSSRWTEFRAKGLDDPDIPAVGVLLDATAHQLDVAELRSQLAEARAELHETRESGRERSLDLSERNEDLDNFAHFAAHDLKAPIRSVRSFGELALVELDPEDSAEPHVQQVVRAAERMGHLVESLLRFSQVGRSRPSMAEIDMHLLVEWVLDHLHSDLSAHDVDVQIEHPLEALTGSDDGVRQIVTNLVSNAVKYRSSRSPVVRISSVRDNGGVRVSVSDNGSGFDQTLAERMFEPFQRLHPTSIAGDGVGLAICKRIVKRHDGRIWATSDGSSGTTVSFWLPDPIETATEPGEDRGEAQPSAGGVDIDVRDRPDQAVRDDSDPSP